MTKQTKKSKTSKKTTTHLKKAGILLLVTSLIFGLFYVGAQHIITSSPQNAPTPIPQINESTHPFMDEKKEPQSALKSCSENRKRETELKNTQYGKGTLIVEFQKGVSSEESQSQLAQFHEISIINSMEIINGYVINIPEGKEFEYICRLEEHGSITSVNLNTLDATN